MSTTVKWGLITGMVYVIFSLVSNMLGLQQGGGGNMAIGLLATTIITLATFFTIYSGIKETRDQELNGFIDLSQAFKAGMKIAVIAGVISAIFTFVNMKFIDPDMIHRMMEGAEDQWDKANMPEEQREMARKMMGFFSNPMISIPFTLLWVAILGALKSLVAGAILKKEAPPTVPTVY